MQHCFVHGAGSSPVLVLDEEGANLELLRCFLCILTQGMSVVLVAVIWVSARRTM